MTDKDFRDILNETLTGTKITLGSKGREYARGDRLSNFKRAASFLGTTPEAALIGMLNKHIVSIYDMVDDLDSNPQHPELQWNEKIGDAINYLILLKALIHERNTWKEPSQE